MLSSVLSRASVTARAALAALRDPTRADAVAQVGEATGGPALREVYHSMLSDPVGRRLLVQKTKTHKKWPPPALPSVPTAVGV